MATDASAGRSFLQRNPEAVGIASLFLALFAVNAWAALVGAVTYREFGFLLGFDNVLSFLFPIFVFHVVGTGLGAWLYARRYGHEIPFGFPEKSRRRVAAGVVSAPIALITITALVANALDTSVSSIAQVGYSPTAQLSFLVSTSFVPAALRGLAYGLLFFGVVHERLRRVTTPRHAILLTPIIAGFFREVTGGSLNATDFEASAIPYLVTIVVVSVAFGTCVGLLYRGTVRDSLADVLRFAYVPVFVVGLLGFVGVALELGEFPTSAVDLLWIGVFGIAAYGYERTRSVWVPVVAMAAFAAGLDAAGYLETVAGVAPVA